MRFLFSRLALLSSLLLLAVVARAQEPPAAGAARIKAVQALPPDSTKVKALITLSDDVLSADNAAAMRYAQQALALARRLHDPLATIKSLGAVGYVATQTGDLVLATQSHQQALALIHPDRPPESRLLFTNLLGLANAYTEQGNFEEAEGYYRQLAARVAAPTTVRQRFNQMVCYHSMGIFYGVWRQSGRAPARVKALALRYPRRSVAACRALHEPVNLTFALISLGQALQDAGRPDSAAYYARQALALARAQRNPQTQYMAYQLLTTAVYAQGQWAASAAAARQALALVQEVGNPADEAQIQHNLGQALAKNGDGLGAYAAAQASQRLRDTLQTTERTRALAQLQVSFKTREQQAQILALQQRNRLAAQAQELTRLRTRQERAGLGTLALLVLAGAGGVVWQYRRRQAARLAAEATALRRRLAADLHDDVGNLLTQLNLQSGLLSEPHAYSPAQVAARLETLAATARRAAQQMSDVVWGLGAAQRTLPELLAHMRDHAQEVLPPAGVDVEFTTALDPTCPAPPAEAQQQLYLVYKEALHNVVKHARATLVQVNLRQTPAGLVLTVADDGRGHDGTARPNGQGLANMQARAAAVGGRAAYRALAPGFEVRVEVPG